ncbi:MAG: hypothetical protein R3D78_06540 [Paracoccaceae bacterium]
MHSGVDKTRKIRQMIGDRPIHIQIDGGVTTETAPLVAAAGADVLVAGSAVFKGGSVANPRRLWRQYPRHPRRRRGRAGLIRGGSGRWEAPALTACPATNCHSYSHA